MADSIPTPRPRDGERLPYEPPTATRHDDWEIVTGTAPSPGPG